MGTVIGEALARAAAALEGLDQDAGTRAIVAALATLASELRSVGSAEDAAEAAVAGPVATNPNEEAGPAV